VRSPNKQLQRTVTRRRASNGNARPLNCGVGRHQEHEQPNVGMRGLRQVLPPSSECGRMRVLHLWEALRVRPLEDSYSKSQEEKRMGGILDDLSPRGAAHRAVQE